MNTPITVPTDITPHNGRFVDGRHYFACRVYFEDTDFSGIVYHANYLRYMERARSDMLRGLDMDQNAAFDAGEGVYAIADLSIKYVRPAKLDDDLVVMSHVQKLRAASVIIDQTILRTAKEGGPRNHCLSQRSGCLSYPSRQTAPTTSSMDKSLCQRHDGRIQNKRTNALLESLSIDPVSGSFSPFALFLQADIIVKLVMFGLLPGEHLDLDHHRQFRDENRSYPAQVRSVRARLFKG